MATRVREKVGQAKPRPPTSGPTPPRNTFAFPRARPRAVIDLIRGKSVREAEAILLYTPKAATEPVAKLLKSVVANAENNLEMNRDELYIAEIYANQGPSLKRFQPVSHGRASAILKRSSHITIVLDQAK